MREGFYINEIVEQAKNNYNQTFVINKQLPDIQANEIIYIPKTSVQQLEKSMLGGTTYITNINLIKYFGGITLRQLKKLLFEKFALTKNVIDRYGIVNKVLHFIRVTCKDKLPIELNKINWFDLVPLRHKTTLSLTDIEQLSVDNLISDYHTLNSFELYEKYGYVLYSVFEYQYNTQLCILNRLVSNIDTERQKFIHFCTTKKHKDLFLCTDTFTKTIQLKSNNNLLEMINIANTEIYKMKSIQKMWYHFSYSINNEQNTITITMYYLHATKDNTSYVLYNMFKALNKTNLRLFIRTIVRARKLSKDMLIF